jgi:hypothetical protein
VIPTWAVFVIVVVIVVTYFLLSNAAKQRRRESVTGDFAKIADFHANQMFTDTKGETALGIDDRGRRIAVARKQAQPRTRVYSFQHIVAAEVTQNGVVVARVARAAQVASEAGGQGGTAPEVPEGDGRPATETAPAGGGPVGDSLFGSTGKGLVAAPMIRPLSGPLTSLGVRVGFQEASDPGVFVRFYEGRPIAVESVSGEKAFAAAQACLNALDIAIKRAALPPRPAIVRV